MVLYSFILYKEYNINQIDLLHTDTEGHDYTILMNYNFEIKPKRIMFEHKHMDGLNTVGIKYDELSNKLDYFIAKDVHNNNLIKKKIVQNFKKKYSWNHLLGKYLRLIQNT